MDHLLSTESKSMPPGFRFHPTDEELFMYYLKRKVIGKSLRPQMLSELDVYRFPPWDLPGKSWLKTRDLSWYFFCPRSKKYAHGGRTNRSTEHGYWKSTGNDRTVNYNHRPVGKIKTLIFHQGKAPKGERTDWVMHEYRLEDQTLVDKGVPQDAYVICKVYKKSGIGPKNGEHHGAPFVEEEWESDDDDDDMDRNAGVVLGYGGCEGGDNPSPLSDVTTALPAHGCAVAFTSTTSLPAHDCAVAFTPPPREQPTAVVLGYGSCGVGDNPSPLSDVTTALPAHGCAVAFTSTTALPAHDCAVAFTPPPREQPTAVVGPNIAAVPSPASAAVESAPVGEVELHPIELLEVDELDRLLAIFQEHDALVDETKEAQVQENDIFNGLGELACGPQTAQLGLDWSQLAATNNGDHYVELDDIPWNLKS